MVALPPCKRLILISGPLLAISSLSHQVVASQQRSIRVLLSEANKVRLRSDGSIPLLINASGLKQSKVSSVSVRAKRGSMQILLNRDPKGYLTLKKNTILRISTKDRRGIWLGRRRYRGELKVKVNHSRLNVINSLDVETYLKSVVGSEMPKTWPMEALKAQAVASRTYALKQLAKSGPFDIRSTETNQVYLGIESETFKTGSAVNSTRGLVLTHKGRMINAVFHSSSGGFTESSGDVWKKQLPYLVGVVDFDKDSPVRSWNRTFSPKQLENAFQETQGVRSIKIEEVTKTGRIKLAKVIGPGGELLIKGRDLRKRLGLKSTLARFQTLTSTAPKKIEKVWTTTSSSNSPLTPLPLLENYWSGNDLTGKSRIKDLPPSNFFSLLPPPLPLPPLEPNGQIITLFVRGLGAGHGVGMSQWGAYNLANRGRGFRHILKHYYSGVDIVPYKSNYQF